MKPGFNVLKLVDSNPSAKFITMQEGFPRRHVHRPPIWDSVAATRAFQVCTRRLAVLKISGLVSCCWVRLFNAKSISASDRWRPKRSRISVRVRPVGLSRSAARILSAVGYHRFSPKMYRADASQYRHTASAARKCLPRITGDLSRRA